MGTYSSPPAPRNPANFSLGCEFMPFHVGLCEVHRHMAVAFDHGLHFVLPGHLAQRVQLGSQLNR